MASATLSRKLSKKSRESMRDSRYALFKKDGPSLGELPVCERV
jgi:hypothetical protein